MKREDCETLEKVYQEPPPGIPWADIQSLFNAIAIEHNGKCDYSPGSYIILCLPKGNGDKDIIRIPYSPTVYRTTINRIELRLVLAGITQCQ